MMIPTTTSSTVRTRVETLCKVAQGGGTSKSTILFIAGEGEPVEAGSIIE